MVSQRNVLFIVIDQLRADCISGALADYLELPNLRGLMADAVSFDAHYTVTSPCGPARASLLTGLYAMNHRSIRNGTPLARDVPNIALEMRKSGYTPLLFGYTDTGLDPRDYDPQDPGMRSYERVMDGFEEQLEMRYEESYPWRAFLKAQGYDIPPYNEIYFGERAPGEEPKINDPAFFTAEHSDTAFLTDFALNTLSVRTDQNWFAHLTYLRPHPPLVAPAPYNTMYDPDNMPMPVRGINPAEENEFHPFAQADVARMARNNLVPGFDPELDKNELANVRALRALYFGLATEVDHHIGRVIAYLKETGQYDNTLIAVGADHGEMLGDHHAWGKELFHEQAAKIPLIIRDPDNQAQFGTRVEAFTESIDVTPTILDWVGQQVPASMDGHSLMPFLRGEVPSNWRDHVFFEMDYGNPAARTFMQQQLDVALHQANFSSLRDQKYKYVHFNGGLQPLLFDLEADPDEFVNLAADPAYAGVVFDMAKKMLDHRMSRANRALSDLAITKNGVVAYQA